jgi:hypothetical protein
VQEYKWDRLLPWWEPNQLAINQAEGCCTVILQGRVHGVRLPVDLAGSAPERHARGGVWGTRAMVDNQSAIALSKNPIFNDRGNHIAVRYNFIRECVDEGRISIKFIATEKQLVDALTKVLGRVRFQELRDEIGIHTTGDHAKD